MQTNNKTYLNECDPHHNTNVICTSIKHDFSTDFISILTFMKYKIATKKAHQPKYYNGVEVRAIVTTSLLNNINIVIRKY
jgi:hypothetical protein